MCENRGPVPGLRSVPWSWEMAGAHQGGAAINL